MAVLKIGDWVKVNAPIKFRSSNGTVWATWSNTRDDYYILDGAMAQVIGNDEGGYIIDMLPDTSIGSAWLLKIDYKKEMFKEQLDKL